MATWKNLDTLASYSKLAELKGHVNIADAMAGEKGAERVCRVERKDPRFPVEVEARGDGIAVTVPSALTSFRGEQRLYVADGLHLFGCSELYTETMGVFLEQMEQGGRECGSRKEKRELLVGSRDIPLFYARVLEGMEALGILQSTEIDWEKYRQRR